MIRLKSRIWLAASLAVLGLLCIAYGRMFGFTGELRIRTGSAEAIAVAPSSPFRLARHTLRKGVAGREVPFANPEDATGWIDANRYYDVASLPYAIAFARADVAAERSIGGALVVSNSDGETRVPVAPGREVSVNGERFAIQAVRPWSGLVQVPDNPPMAELTFSSVAEAEDATRKSYYLPDGAWIRADDHTAVHFRWVMSEKDVEQAIGNAERQNVARWGIVLKGQGDWLTSFQPGSGLVTADGVNVVLIQRDDAYPGQRGTTSAIEVALESAEGVDQRWIQVNEIVPDFPVRYENLGAMPRVVYVLAWEPERAAVYTTDHDSRSKPALLERGETWTDAGLQLRLDDVQPSATAIQPEASSQFEVVLESRDREFSVPENSPVRQEASILRFEARVQPAEVTYHLGIYRSGDEVPEVIVLGPDGSFTANGWHMTQNANRHTSADVAVFQLRRQFPVFVTIAGQSALIAATLLLLTTRRIGKTTVRPRILSHL